MPHPQDRVTEVADQIRAVIADAGIVRGQKIPSQDELARRINTSKSTVARAVAILESEGLVSVGAGGTTLTSNLSGASGVIVPGNLSWPDHAAASANQDGTTFNTINTFTDARITTAPDYVAKYLDVPEGSDVVYRFRERRTLNGSPLMLAETWAPAAHAENIPEMLMLEDVPGGIARTEEALGREYRWILETVQAVRADPRTAAFYECEVGSPVLLLDHRWLFPDNEPLLFGRGWQPSERRLTYRMLRP